MGTAGHMKHTFDIPSVKNGNDLIHYFDKIKEHLGINPASVKFDGSNVSFKLVTKENGQKEFRVDRGTSKIMDVRGMTTEDASKRWDDDHGMPLAIKTVLEIFNNALPLIKEELTTLGMWDDPTKFFNAEFVNKKTNVLEYKNNFIAIHGINQFYEKKAQPHRIKSGESMNRPGLPRIDKSISLELEYDTNAFSSLLEKARKYSENFEIYGDVPTTLIKEITFKDALDTDFTVCFKDNLTETHTLREWLTSATNPMKATIKDNSNKKLFAISKAVYLKVLNQEPLMEVFNSAEDIKLAINGALFNHATRVLGNEIKKSLTSDVGDVMFHEGIVLRNLENYPVKVTGEFIIDGLNSVFKENNKKTKTALIPGGFKPPHRGHLALVTHYLDEVGPDGKVIIFMGSGGKNPRTINGNPITYEDALNIWEIYLKNEGLSQSKNLEFRKIEGSPLGKVIDYVTEANPNLETIYLGAGEKDGDRWKFMLDNPKYNPNGVDVYVEAAPNYTDLEGNPMSSTNFRKAIESGDKKLVKSYIPQSSHKDYEKIVSFENSRLEETQAPLGIFLRLIEEVIEERAESEKQRRWACAQAGKSRKKFKGKPSLTASEAEKMCKDPLKEEEEELEEISAMGAGAVEGSAGKIDNEEESLIREVEDYLFSALGVDS